MDKDRYVKEIVRKIQCGGDKKKEIKMQLLTEIEDRMQQGEEPAAIMEQMGSVEEIAAGFNENLSEQEKKKYQQGKTFKIVLAVLAGVLVMVSFGGWYLYSLQPKIVEMENSEYFVREQVEEAMRRTIDLWDAEDYAALRELSDPRVASLLNKENMDRDRAKMAEDWGKRQAIGKSEAVEVIEKSRHYAVGEIQVTYENVKVIYRLTYDEQMRLCGIYFR